MANHPNRSKARRRVVWATAEELLPLLGPGWTICRATPDNIARYGNCITRAQYDAAVDKALAARTASV